MIKSKYRKLRRRQLDRALAQNAPISDLPNFKRGYIREIREALEISSTQLAKKLNVTQPAVVKLEKNEREGSITLNSLRKAAESLGCDLVYGFIPKTSLKNHLEEQAKKAAINILNDVQHSMALERQSTSAEEESIHLEDLTRELIESSNKQIWEFD